MDSLVKLIVGIIVTVLVLVVGVIALAFTNIPGAENEGITWGMVALVVIGGISGLVALIRGDD